MTDTELAELMRHRWNLEQELSAASREVERLRESLANVDGRIRYEIGRERKESK